MLFLQARRRNVRNWLETVNRDNGLLVGRRTDDDPERSVRATDPEMRGIGLTVTDNFVHEHSPGQGYQPQPQQKPAPLSPRLLQPPDPDLDPETVLSLAPDEGKNAALGDQSKATCAGHQQQKLPTPRNPTLTGGAEDAGALALAGMGAQFDPGEGRSEEF